MPSSQLRVGIGAECDREGRERGARDGSGDDIGRIVDHEDPGGHDGRHVHEHHRVLLQPEPERRLGLPFAQPHRDRPEAVRAPVSVTTPWPLPSLTTVPMNAQEGSANGDAGDSMGSTCSFAGTGSPVGTDSSHSRPFACSSRRSAGTTSPTASSITSPGTSVVRSKVAGLPLRRARAVCRS
jgi:hypothetical protein